MIKLYAFQPKGHGELSFFVAAESHMAAVEAIEAEIVRRKTISEYEDGRITDGDVTGWGTDYYQMTSAVIGAVLINNNQ